MSPLSFRTVKAYDTSLLQEIYNLRVTCRKEFGEITFAKYPSGWTDEMDSYSEHYIVTIDNKIIASGRLTFFHNISFHPFYNEIGKLIPENLKNTPIAYLSKDQVIHEFRGKGLRTRLLSLREDECKRRNVRNLIIDVDIAGRQYSNFNKNGYTALGHFTIEKKLWGVGQGILMHKFLR